MLAVVLVSLFVGLHAMSSTGKGSGSESHSSDGEKYSEDSELEEETDLSINVYQVDGNPEVVFYDSTDEEDAVYCLVFIGSYETEEYVNATATEVVEGSEVDFSDLDWIYNTSATDDYDFQISTSGEKFDDLTYTFHLQETEDGQSQLKFDISIEGYMWESTDDPETPEDETQDNQYVLILDVRECSDTYEVSEESGESDSQSGTGTGTGSGSETDSGTGTQSTGKGSSTGSVSDDDDAGGRRRALGSHWEDIPSIQKHGQSFVALRNLRKLLQDSSDDEEEDSSTGTGKGSGSDTGTASGTGSGTGTGSGSKSESGSGTGSDREDSPGISSDDENTFDLDAMFFTIAETADGDTNNDGEIEEGSVNAQLFYDGDSRLNVVFDYFGTQLYQDPSMGVDKSKLDEDSASMYTFALAMCVQVLALFFF